MPRAELENAYRLLKSGDKAAATPIIKQHLKDYPTDPNGWWLAYHASSDMSKRRAILDRVLELDPNHTGARREVAKLEAQDDDLFFDVQDSISSQPKPKANASRPVLGYVLLGFALVALLCGGVTVAFFVSGASFLGNFVEELAENVTFEPGQSFAEENDAAFQGHGWTVLTRGSIRAGGTVNGDVDTFDDDGWLLTGSAGQTVTIELNETDGQLDTQLYLYAPDGRLIAENDDIDFPGNTNSRLTLTLPEEGTYGIVVSAFASGGTYRLTVR